LLLTALPGGAFAEQITLPYRDITLNANLAMAPGKTFTDGVILIIHGTQAHNGLELINGLQERFLDHDRNSLAITLSLGVDDRRGLYDCSIPSTYRHSDAVEEIHTWVAWLDSQGVSDVVLAAHSRGGSQSLWYATEHNQDVIKSLVLLASGLSTTEREVSAYRERFDTELEPLLARAQALVDADKGDTLLEHIPFLFICRDTSVTAEAFDSFYRDDPRRDTPYWLDKIAKPTLILVGENDEVVPELSERVSPFADGKRVQVAVIEGAGHFFRDLNLDDAVDAAIEFIEAVESDQ
jgi:pimeloyl-ACP methyl ester carboxylesterase